eukprot:2629202-Pyramimonas_sp.AAC.1
MRAAGAQADRGHLRVPSSEFSSLWSFCTANVTSWPRCHRFLKKECDGVTCFFLQECKVERADMAQAGSTLLKAGWNVRFGACEVTRSGGLSLGVRCSLWIRRRHGDHG